MALDARRAALTGTMNEPQLPALHPDMDKVFRQKATTLAEGLEHETSAMQHEKRCADSSTRSSSRRGTNY